MNEIISNLLWVIQIISAVLIVILVLLQHGKGADAGATFGSGGGSASLFGASGSSNFLSKSTAILAAIFFLTTFGQVFMSSGRIDSLGIMSGLSNKKTPVTKVENSSIKSSNIPVTTKGQSKQIPN